METNKFDGEVLWYSDHLGYGIIKGKDHKTYFIHYSDIVSSSSIDEIRHRNHLLKGEKVLFGWIWKDGADKRQAINLRVVEDSANGNR